MLQHFLTGYVTPCPGTEVATQEFPVQPESQLLLQLLDRHRIPQSINRSVLWALLSFGMFSLLRNMINCLQKSTTHTD